MVCEKRTMNDWNQFSLKMPLTKSYWNSFHSALLNLQQFCCKIRLNRTYFRSISKQASNKHTLPLITLLHWAHFISFYSISHLCSQFFMSTERRDEQNEIFKCWNCVWKKSELYHFALHCIVVAIFSMCSECFAPWWSVHVVIIGEFQWANGTQTPAQSVYVSRNVTIRTRE